MNYRIVVYDNSPLNSDWRNSPIKIADINIEANEAIALSLYQFFLEKYPHNKDIEVHLYKMEQKSTVILEKVNK